MRGEAEATCTHIVSDPAELSMKLLTVQKVPHCGRRGSTSTGEVRGDKKSHQKLDLMAVQCSLRFSTEDGPKAFVYK
jgi:hypothetical protein